MEAAVVPHRVDVAERVPARVADAYRLARAILLDDDEAEDVAQEACLAAWRKSSSLRDAGAFDAWFDRIVVNLCRDRIRARARVRDISPRSTGRPWHLDAHDLPGDDIDLDRAVDGLDLDHRVVVLLRFWQDRTVDEIAARLGIPAGTVKSRLHHALRRIRETLEASDGRP